MRRKNRKRRITNTEKTATNMPEEHRNASCAYQGAKYFSYNGKVLDDIRENTRKYQTK